MQNCIIYFMRDETLCLLAWIAIAMLKNVLAHVKSSQGVNPCLAATDSPKGSTFNVENE